MSTIYTTPEVSGMTALDQVTTLITHDGEGEKYRELMIDCLKFVLNDRVKPGEAVFPKVEGATQHMFVGSVMYLLGSNIASYTAEESEDLLEKIDGFDAYFLFENVISVNGDYGGFLIVSSIAEEDREINVKNLIKLSNAGMTAAVSMMIANVLNHPDVVSVTIEGVTATTYKNEINVLQLMAYDRYDATVSGVVNSAVSMGVDNQQSSAISSAVPDLRVAALCLQALIMRAMLTLSDEEKKQFVFTAKAKPWSAVFAALEITGSQDLLESLIKLIEDNPIE